VKVAKEVSKLFPPPISLAYEEKIYWRFMILTKKRYMSLACERDGKVEDKISKKGVLLQRRDNCSFIRKVYGEVVMMIFNKKSRDHVLSYVLEEINKLCSGFYPVSDFVVTKSIGDTGNLEPSESVDKDGKTCYKIGDYKVKLLPTDKKEREKQFKLKNCEKESEYYLKCLPAQAQLAEKMRVRGQLVSAGSRLEYVITNQGGHNAKQYEKVEDVFYYSKHSGSLKLDYMYYLKQLSSPLDQIIDIIYTKDENGKEYKKEFTLEQYQYRCQVREKVLKQLKNLFVPKLNFRE
jgi:DNA polymerase elongation subunit (family B)